MSSVTDILASIAAKRNNASNPVISAAVAQMLGGLSSTNFDPEEDAELILAPLPKRFTTSAYSRMAWCLDTQLKNDLKAVEMSLETTFDPADRTESFFAIQNELDSKWNSELNGYEIGNEEHGPMHRIAAILNIRLAYHEDAETFMKSQRKMYSVKSIDVQIGDPVKQKLGANDLANFRFNALATAQIETNVVERNMFDNSVVWTNEMTTLMESTAHIKSITKTSTENIEKIKRNDARVEELTNYLMNISDQCRSALTTYCKFVEERKTLIDKWYQAELNRIPVMLSIRDFCQRKVPDEKLKFDELPRSLQVVILDNLDASLTQTMNNLTNSPPELYRDYKAATDELHKWLSHAIDARMNNETGVPVVASDSVEAMKRSNKRRGKSTLVTDQPN